MTTPPKALHYAGELVYRSGAQGSMHILPGWAACCFDDAARKIRRERRHTYDRAAVTCKRCLACIAREIPGTT